MNKQLKEKFGKELIESFKDSHVHEKQLWVTLPSSGCLRLTDLGYGAMCAVYGGNYEVNLQSTNDPMPFTKLLILLGRYLEVPYFVRKEKLVIWDSRMSMEMNLHDSASSWLDSMNYKWE